MYLLPLPKFYFEIEESGFILVIFAIKEIKISTAHGAYVIAKFTEINHKKNKTWSL